MSYPPSFLPQHYFQRRIRSFQSLNSFSLLRFVMSWVIYQANSPGFKVSPEKEGLLLSASLGQGTVPFSQLIPFLLFCLESACSWKVQL